MTITLNPTYDEKPAFSRQNQGKLTTWQYVDYLGLLARKRMILNLIPDADFKQFPREHPTLEEYSELVEIAKKAGLR